MGELREKMQDVIERQIIQELKAGDAIAKRIVAGEKILFTLVFDRECYLPSFLHRLWEKHQIAAITYRKNVKDKWGENLFQSHAVTILGNTVTLLLYEQNVELGGYTFREIRCFNESGHQTAIITTNEEITLSEVASKMFSRWSQENFLKYLIADYDFDKMIQYGSEAIDENRKIVNPEYRKINHKIKELAEKIQRKEAKFYKVAEQINEEDIDEIPTLTRYQIQSMGNIIALKKEREALITERSKMQSKIMLKEMPDVTRLNKLKPEK